MVTMRFEVEQKFRVAGFGSVEQALARLGATINAPVEQVDWYLSHPGRDFATTGEALRVRQSDTQNALTYKGPKIDAHTKTRHEIELPLPEGREYFEHLMELLEALGFRPLAEVRKQRRKAYVVGPDGESLEVSLDVIEGLGTFVELELVAESAGVPQAREQLAQLARQLGLADNERRSYLELLMASSQATAIS